MKSGRYRLVTVSWMEISTLKRDTWFKWQVWLLCRSLANNYFTLPVFSCSSVLPWTLVQLFQFVPSTVDCTECVLDRSFLSLNGEENSSWIRVKLLLKTLVFTCKWAQNTHIVHSAKLEVLRTFWVYESVLSSCYKPCYLNRIKMSIKLTVKS